MIEQPIADRTTRAQLLPFATIALAAAALLSGCGFADAQQQAERDREERAASITAGLHSQQQAADSAMSAVMEASQAGQAAYRAPAAPPNANRMPSKPDRVP